MYRALGLPSLHRWFFEPNVEDTESAVPVSELRPTHAMRRAAFNVWPSKFGASMLSEMNQLQAEDVRLKRMDTGLLTTSALRLRAMHLPWANRAFDISGWFVVLNISASSGSNGPESITLRCALSCRAVDGANMRSVASDPL